MQMCSSGERTPYDYVTENNYVKNMEIWGPHLLATSAHVMTMTKEDDE